MRIRYAVVAKANPMIRGAGTFSTFRTGRSHSVSVTFLAAEESAGCPQVHGGIRTQLLANGTCLDCALLDDSSCGRIGTACFQVQISGRLPQSGNCCYEAITLRVRVSLLSIMYSNRQCLRRILAWSVTIPAPERAVPAWLHLDRPLRQ